METKQENRDEKPSERKKKERQMCADSIFFVVEQLYNDILEFL